MKRGLTLLLLLFPLLSGCAHVLSKEALRSVNPAVDLAMVRENPDRYIGQTLLLGGTIVDNKAGREGTVLEVVSYTLDRWGGPDQPDEAGGRFLAKTTRFLDPSLFRAGYFITMTGTLTGEETHDLNGSPYTYPVFTIGEAYVRDITPYPPRPSPYYYDPFYYRYPYGPGVYPYYPFGPYYDPFWYTPPPPRRPSVHLKE